MYSCTMCLATDLSLYLCMVLVCVQHPHPMKRDTIASHTPIQLYYSLYNLQKLNH